MYTHSQAHTHTHTPAGNLDREGKWIQETCIYKQSSPCWHCLLPTDPLTLLPEPPVPLRHKDRGSLFNLTDGERAYKGKAVRTHPKHHASCAGGKQRPCPGCGLFFHRNCLTPPGKAFPELKLGKQRKMQKPLEPSQQMSYKAIGPNTVLRPGKARPVLVSVLPTPRGLYKTRTLDPHTEVPKALENYETIFFSKPEDSGTLFPDCHCLDSSHKGPGILQEHPGR